MSLSVIIPKWIDGFLAGKFPRNFRNIENWRTEIRESSDLLKDKYILYLRDFSNALERYSHIVSSTNDDRFISTEDVIFSLTKNKNVICVKNQIYGEGSTVFPVYPILHSEWMADVDYMIKNADFIIIAFDNLGDGLMREIDLISKLGMTNKTVMIRPKRKYDDIREVSNGRIFNVIFKDPVFIDVESSPENYKECFDLYKKELSIFLSDIEKTRDRGILRFGVSDPDSVRCGVLKKGQGVLIAWDIPPEDRSKDS